MNIKEKPTITIIGAGVAGLFLALQFAKRGFKVNVYEKYTRKEAVNYSSNRSFNVTFYQYAKDILEANGLWKYLKEHIVVLDGSYTQISSNIKPVISKFDDGIPYYCITRVRLLDVLLSEAAKSKNIQIHFNTALLSINKYDKTILVQNNTSKKISRVFCDVIFGCDGVHSLTRSFMQQGLEAKHSQEYYEWTYKQIVFYKKQASQLNLKKKVMYAWSRKNAILLAFPDEEEGYSSILILPQKGKYTYGVLDEIIIAQLVQDEFPFLKPILPHVTHSLLTNPEGKFVTVHTDPWFSHNFIAILGDAAHGFFPFYGQGVSASIGDCVCLMKLVDTYETDWKTIFPLYQKQRKASMDALGEVSKESSKDYRRTKLAHYEAIYTKVESVLHRIFPYIIKPHPFIQIAKDPGNTFSILENHRKQRKILNAFGLSFGVSLLTGLVYIYELLRGLFPIQVRFSH